MPSDITLAINALIKSGNVDGNTTTTYGLPDFQIDNIYPVVKHLFNAKAISALENKAHSLLYQYNEFVGYKGFDHFYKVQDLLKKVGVGAKIPDVPVGYIRRFDLVYYFGSTCRPENIGEAVSKVISAINIVADMGFTRASLMPLGVLKLHPLPEEKEGKLVVLSYLTLSEAGKQYVDQNMPKILVSEGAIPSNVEEQ